MTPETIRRRALVSGRVQGVGFRWACRRMADEVGVAGWCRNLADGRVEVCFEGARPAVERALAWAGQGPAHARVTHVDVVEEPPGNLSGFSLG